VTAETKKKKFLTAEEIAAEIDNRNKIFAAATPEQKRVLIAKDVIEQIKAKRFKPTSGTWVRPKMKNGRYIEVEERFDGEESVRELFIGKKIPACDCCALGAMFMSCTTYNEGTTVDYFSVETDWGFEERVLKEKLSNGLTDFFTPDQLQLIEIAFEGGDGAFTADEDDDLIAQKAALWYEDMSRDDKRMVAIMENIIANNGTFVP
jgi:hypothetical protein